MLLDAFYFSISLVCCLLVVPLIQRHHSFLQLREELRIEDGFLCFLHMPKLSTATRHVCHKSKSQSLRRRWNLAEWWFTETALRQDRQQINRSMLWLEFLLRLDGLQTEAESKLCCWMVLFHIWFYCPEAGDMAAWWGLAPCESEFDWPSMRFTAV